jgi:hypothetical protein
MNTLYIFADESGTMPINDSDKPFVTTTIAFEGEIPETIPGSNDALNLISILKKLNAMPLVAIVKPFSGYGQKLTSKYIKIKTMARARCLLNGQTIRYLDKNDINLHNEVWQHAMLQSIIHIIFDAVFDYPSIHEVEFIFDQKTMRRDRRNFFEKIVSNINIPLNEYLLTYKKQYSDEIISSVTDKIQFSQNSISIHWSDDPIPDYYKFGLKLADCLARKMYQSLQGDPDFYSTLQGAGFENCIIDITNAIIRPLNRKLIEKWQKDTGLPEPRI